MTPDTPPPGRPPAPNPPRRPSGAQTGPVPPAHPDPAAASPDADPAQGSAGYRDRPADEGKHGDAAEEPNAGVP